MTFVLPSDDKSRVSIINAVKEASNSKLRIESEKDLIKDIAAKLKDELGMPPAVFNQVFNQLVSTYHKQDVAEKQAKAEEFFEIYEVLFR